MIIKYTHIILKILSAYILCTTCNLINYFNKYISFIKKDNKIESYGLLRIKHKIFKNPFCVKRIEN